MAALGALATNIMLTAFPAMAPDLDVSPREVACTLSSFFVVFAVGQLFVGPLIKNRVRLLSLLDQAKRTRVPRTPAR